MPDPSGLIPDCLPRSEAGGGASWLGGEAKMNATKCTDAHTIILIWVLYTSKSHFFPFSVEFNSSFFCPPSLFPQPPDGLCRPHRLQHLPGRPSGPCAGARPDHSPARGPGPQLPLPPNSRCPPPVWLNLAPPEGGRYRPLGLFELPGPGPTIWGGGLPSS